MATFYQPDLLYHDGQFKSGSGLLVGDDGRVASIANKPPADDVKIVSMPGKILLPGFVNAHSHTFQRLIRGRSENRGINGDNFWTWRDAMYKAAASLNAEDLYDVSRMAFLEMVLAGTTTVGEFHYLHRAQNGRAYEDPNLLSKTVIAAARSVGIRIVLLRVAYFRAGYELSPDAGQARFYESPGEYLENTDALAKEIGNESKEVSIGVAPHSIRAVPLKNLSKIVEWATARHLPIHMHVAEQTAEIDACVKEYRVSPVALLADHRLLSSKFTFVHAIHLTSAELDALAKANAIICSCPTTERNLGDGIVAAHGAAARGIRFAFGSDSQVQIDPLEDARELEYHLRLIQQKRVILDQIGKVDLSKRLFDYATMGGAESLGIDSGKFETGKLADFFTIDRNDVSIAGAAEEDLLPSIVFSLSRAAIHDVAVGGRLIVRDSVHQDQQEIIARYRDLHQRVWTHQATRSFA